MTRTTIVTRVSKSLLLLVALLCLASPFAAIAHAAPDLIAVGSISGTYEDFATETAGLLENGIPGNRLGGMGSSLVHHGDDPTWADHTDTRPTMLALLGLKDSYEHDGRVLVGQLDAWAVPQSSRAHRHTLERLGEVYKQLNAPFGQFGMDTLTMSTKAVKSGTASDDSTYTALSASIGSFTDRRDALAARMKSVLDAAGFRNEPIQEFEAAILIFETEILLDLLHRVAQH
jgi:hypothetical protein